MTRTDDFIGQLESYLDEYEGSTPLPEDVRDAIRADLPSTHQRPAWWPARRFPEMNNMMKLGLATAGVVVAALLGYNYLLAPNVGGPGIDDPLPTPTPTPAAMSGGEVLEPGTYRLTAPADADVVLPESATITVPAGWASQDLDRVYNGEPPRSTAGSAHATIGFWLWDGDFETIYLDPCQWRDGAVEPPVGPTVDDLANALADQPQRGDAVPVDVTIGGYSGKMIQLTVPSDVDFHDCELGEFRSWSGRFHQGPGQVDEIYILDVDGQRTVIDAAYMPDTSEADLADFRAIIESIQLGGP